MRRSVLTGCRLLETDCLKEGGRFSAAFVTLTLRPEVECGPGAIREFTNRVRQWYSRRGVAFRYVWTAELTKRGRLHYHALFWLPKGLTLPKPDRRGWWPWGWSRIERARHAGAYLAKYVSKGGASPKDYPKGFRIHGTGGLSAPSADERRWWLSPSWVREQVPIEHRPFRNPVGGGFVARVTGELLPSPYRVVGIAGGFVRLVRVTPP